MLCWSASVTQGHKRVTSAGCSPTDLTKGHSVEWPEWPFLLKDDTSAITTQSQVTRNVQYNYGLRQFCENCHLFDVACLVNITWPLSLRDASIVYETWPCFQAHKLCRHAVGLWADRRKEYSPTSVCVVPSRLQSSSTAAIYHLQPTNTTQSDNVNQSFITSRVRGSLPTVIHRANMLSFRP